MVCITCTLSDEYLNPEVYDVEYGQYTADFPLFIDIKSRGSALDLACGTGRLTIALANSGLKCIGLDASVPMLERARLKSKELDIQYYEGDIRDFHFEESFDIITLTGNSFQTLLTLEDQKKLFSCVRSHLKTDGLFIFNTRNFRKQDLTTTQEFEHWHAFTDQDGHMVQVYGKQTYHPESSTVLYLTKRVWPSHVTMTETTLRFTLVEELISLLEESGFEVIQLYGDLNKTPYQKESPAIIPLCRARV